MNCSCFRISIALVVLANVMSGCGNWAARAVKHIPASTALDRPYAYDGHVVVVGAGPAGLAAAKVMAQNGVSCTVLEATDRLGGRLKKDTMLADFPIDLGAEWIHSNPVVLNRMKGKPGDEVEEELIPYRLESSSTWDGKELRPLTDRFMNRYYEFMPESKFKHSTWYDFVMNNIGDEVADNVIHKSVVSRVDWTGESVEVVTTDGQRHTADKVILAVPVGVLQKDAIEFIPPLDKIRSDALQRIDFLTGFKMFLRFEKCFYPNVVNCEVPFGGKVFYDVAFKKEASSHVMALLVQGEIANKYFELGSKEAMVRAALNELDVMFDGEASKHYTGEWRLENWGQAPHIEGTWTAAYRERSRDLEIIRRPLGDKVFFAGEIFDMYRQMGVPGAVLSGFDAAHAALTSKAKGK
ncbi:FAD-dependent oxidoreductase [Flavobacteriales bacterium]|nr:FAD-dependent oxidoreductase [Flavobacteriales bacterium]